MSWTVDARCSRCLYRKECPDRDKLVPELGGIANTLNTTEPFMTGHGDGILIVACNDFQQGDPI